MNRSGFKVLPVVFLLALSCALLPTAALAQFTVSGNVINESLWDGRSTPGGLAESNAYVHIGLWNQAATIIAGSPAPLVDTNVAYTGPTTVLPFLLNASYTYSIANVPNGDYYVVAWIETDDNAQYDPGEPRSGGSVTVEDAHALGITVSIADDSDNDGMDDWWEDFHFQNLDEVGSSDYDNDGLTNEKEFEHSQTYANLVNLEPDNWDTDGDLMDDGWEFTFYASGSGTHPVTNDASADPDNDGLSNIQEYGGMDGHYELIADPALAGRARANTSDGDQYLSPIDLDSDSDNLIDSFEAAWGLDPNAANSHLSDQDEDGLTHYREQCLLPVLAQGGSNDIWLSGVSAIPTKVGGWRSFGAAINLGVATNLTTIPAAASKLRDHEWTDPYDGGADQHDGWDTDGDWLPDGWELEYNLDPRKTDSETNGYWGDPDNDGLVNYEEYRGQDGERGSSQPHINGTGDETNPFEHNWRPLSTGSGEGAERPRLLGISSNYWNDYTNSPTTGTLGAALPTVSVGADTNAWDTDDDGTDDNLEIQGGGTSPVHSMHPFNKASASITSTNGMVLPDPEGGTNTYGGYRPLIHGRNWTIECYIKKTNPAANLNGYLMNCQAAVQGTNGVAWRMELIDNVPRVSFDTLGGKNYYVEGVEIPSDRWIHLAGVWDTFENSLSLYVDGIFVLETNVFEESLSGYRYSCPAPPMFGQANDNSFTGNLLMDEIRIWGESRTASQLEQYRTKLVDQNEAGLLAYFRFDDGGDTAEDFAKKAQNGLQGATSTDYFYGDHGFAISGGFTLDTGDYAPVRGVDKRGADDSDGDGLPDGWEMVNHLDPLDSSGINGQDGDPDGDGLQNQYEFWAETNPNAEDTDGDGVLDLNEDRDGDGVVNGTEQTLNSRPDIIDTDDDGYADNQEQGNGSALDNPVDPSISLAMWFGGSSNDYLEVPNAFGQRLTDWTIEGWINPATAEDGYIARRVVETPSGGNTAVNFELGIAPTNAADVQAFAGYSFADGTTYRVYSEIIPTGQYTHVSASYDSLNARLTIYTNGAQSGSSFDQAYLAPPINGKGGETFLRIGEDFSGMVDHLRIWNDVRLLDEIVANYEAVVSGSSQGLLHYFRFDDGQATNSPFAFGTYHQAHGAQDFTYSADWNDEWVHAARTNGDTAFVLSSAILSPPQLSVILDPPTIRTPVVVGDDYGQWSFDGDAMRDSGVQITTVDGLHSISYQQLTGWEAPTNEALSLVDGQVAVLTRTYVQNGAIRRTLQPQAAIDEGARWRVDGGGWQGSGVTISNLAASVAHLVEYEPVTGWISPSWESVTVTPGGTDNQTRWYTSSSQAAQTTDTWGGQGIGNGEFLNPKGIVADLRYVYVADTGNDRLQKFDAFVERWTVFATGGAGVGRFDHPMGLDLDDSGNLWVADTGNHRVQRMTPGGTWTVFGSYGSGSGQFNGPFDVAMDTDGSLYVADHYNSRIQKRTSGGVWSTVVGPGAKEGEVRYPNGLAIRDDRLIVTDYDLLTERSRVQEFTLGGIYMRRLGSSDSMSEGMFKRPMGVCAGLTTNVYVADTGWSDLHNVYATNNWTVPLTSASLNVPEDLDLDEWGNLYIVDTGSNRVLRLNADDEDGDSLPDWVEAVVGTSTNNPDTDGDGLLDGDELLGGIDPLDPNSTFLMPISPTGTLAAAATPTLTWAPEPNSTWYYIWIARNGSAYHREWVSFATNWSTAAQWAGGMRSGSYQWWIRGWNPSGWATPWSSESRFEIPYYRPGKTSLTGPSTRENDDDTPAFTWSAVTDAQWYRLYIQAPSGSKYADFWTNTVTWTPTASMPMGDSYTWWVRTWSGDGMGPWSSSRSLTLGKAQPVSPAGVTTSPVTLTWGAAAIPSYFRPFIQNRSTGATVNPGWQLGGTTFGPTALASGNYRWWVRTWNANGMGPWSIGVDFTVQ